MSEPSDTSTVSVSRETRAAVARLWQRMGEVYGAQWIKQYGEVGQAAFETWCLALADLSEQDIRRGFSKALARQSKWVPNLNEFRAMCLLDPAELGMPNKDQAYLEACQHSGRPSTGRWSHPAVYVAGRATGWFELRQSPESKTRPIFERNYDIAIRRVLKGENLDAEIPKGLPPKGRASRRVSPRVAKSRLASLRASISGSAQGEPHEQP